MPKRKEYSRTVYTTEDGRICPECGRPAGDCACRKKKTPAAGDGIVRVSIDRKGRGGKTVTVINGIAASEAALKALAVELKRRCGTGGAVKDGVIEIQGNHREVILDLLHEKGYRAKAAGG